MIYVKKEWKLITKNCTSCRGTILERQNRNKFRKTESQEKWRTNNKTRKHSYTSSTIYSTALETSFLGPSPSRLSRTQFLYPLFFANFTPLLSLISFNPTPFYFQFAYCNYTSLPFALKWEI